MAKPKRNKLSQRRLDKKRKQIEGMQHQRYKAWMLNEMIDKDSALVLLQKLEEEKLNEGYIVNISNQNISCMSPSLFINIKQPKK